MVSTSRLRLIQGGLSLRPAVLEPVSIERDLQRRHAAAASRWLRAYAPRSAPQPRLNLL